MLRRVRAGGCRVFSGGGIANPTAPTVMNGQVTFATQGKNLTVTNSPGAIINWGGFSIRADEATHFVQQSSSSSVPRSSPSSPAAASAPTDLKLD